MLNTVEHLDKRPFDLRGAELSKQIKVIAWPDKPEDINLNMMEDIAQKIAQATGADVQLVKAEMDAVIAAHYASTGQQA